MEEIKIKSFRFVETSKGDYEVYYTRYGIERQIGYIPYPLLDNLIGHIPNYTEVNKRWDLADKIEMERIEEAINE